MSDQKNTPGADAPLPEKAETPGAFPDLTAHSDAPAWLSADGSHDTTVWERNFGGRPEAEGTTPEAAGTSANPGSGGDPETPADDVELPPEPVVVAPEELELVEPTLAEPTLGSDAVDAVALDEVASETAAVEANAAEAGRLSGLEPAPAGAEIPVDATAAGAAAGTAAGTAAGAAAGTGTGADADADAEAEAEAETDADAVANADAEAGVGGDTGAETSATAAADSTGVGAGVDAVAGRAGDGAGDAAVDAADAENAPAADAAAGAEADASAAPEEPDADADADSKASADFTDASAAPTGPGRDAAAPDAVEEEPPAQADTAPEKPVDEEKPSRPLEGIDAAAPVTGALPGQKQPPVSAAAAEPEPTTASIATGETRRSRRLAESQATASGASAVRDASGKNAAPGEASEQPDAQAGTTGPESNPGKGRSNTRLLLVIGGVVLAAVIAILLVVFVFNGKGEGVIDENVSPVDLEAGACLQGWENVNSEADVVTCETPHDAQLVASETFTGGDGFPGTAALEERVNDVCDAVDYADSASSYPDLKLAKSIPTEQTWSNGDRRLDCFVFSPEGQELTESLLRE